MLGCLGSFLLFHYVSAIQPATRPPPLRRPAGGSGAVLGLHDLPLLRLCCVYIYGVLGAHYEQNNTNSDNGRKEKNPFLLLTPLLPATSYSVSDGGIRAHDLRRAHMMRFLRAFTCLMALKDAIRFVGSNSTKLASFEAFEA